MPAEYEIISRKSNVPGIGPIWPISKISETKKHNIKRGVELCTGKFNNDNREKKEKAHSKSGI